MMSEMPQQDSPTRKRPTGKIAFLAGISVVVLGISIWALVAAQVPGNAAIAASEQPSVTTASQRDTNTSTQSNSVDNSRDEKSQSDDSNPAASASENASSAGEGAPGGTTGGGFGQGAAEPAAQGQSGNTPANPGGNVAPQAINVTLSISCTVAIEAGSATARAVSDNGAMRYATLRLNAGTTVYEALVASGAALSAQGAQGSPLGVYVFAIDGLPQGEAGSQSGWKYYVNGTAPGMSCDKYVLSNGDAVEWRYVTNA